jgi:hypothetical protein
MPKNHGKPLRRGKSRLPGDGGHEQVGLDRQEFRPSFACHNHGNGSLSSAEYFF